MTTAYAKARKELAERLDDDRMACATCQAPTLRETLSLYGARCFACYGDYCRGDRSLFGPVSFAEKRDILAALREVASRMRPPFEWAHKLRDRDKAGERLTPTQRSMYRSVLAARQGLPVLEDAL